MVDLLSRTEIEDWCRQQLSLYDRALSDVTDLEMTVKGSPIIHEAKIKRAKSKLDSAEVLADVAAYIFQILADTKTGTITMDIPEGEIKLKLRW